MKDIQALENDNKFLEGEIAQQSLIIEDLKRVVNKKFQSRNVNLTKLTHEEQRIIGELNFNELEYENEESLDSVLF